MRTKYLMITTHIEDDTPNLEHVYLNDNEKFSLIERSDGVITFLPATEVKNVLKRKPKNFEEE